jgi:hypothetical protein
VRPRLKWEDNIKMDLQEMGCGVMDWIELAQDRNRLLGEMSPVPLTKFQIAPTLSFLISSGSSPITYKCLFKVLFSVRRPITTLDCVLLKDNNLALVARLGPEIISRACHCVLQGSRHITRCWLSIQHYYLSSYVPSRDPGTFSLIRNIETSNLISTSCEILVVSKIRNLLMVSGKMNHD